MASVTSTYARAFVDVVLDKRLDATKILQELHALGALLAEHRDLRRIWENPAIPAQQKRNLLDAIVAHEGISRPVRNFQTDQPLPASDGCSLRSSICAVLEM